MDGEQTTGTKYQPQSLWRLYLLVVLTMGLYLIFWFYRQLKHQHQNSEIKLRAWIWVLISLFPAVDIYVYYFVIRNIIRSTHQGRRPEAWLAAISLSLIGNAGWFFQDNNLVLIILTLLLPLPVLWVQFRINRSRSGSVATSLAFSNAQWYALALGIIASFTFLLFVQFDAEVPATGISRKAVGSVIVGPGGFYSVQLPDGNWKKVPSGTIQEGSEIELLDAKNDVKAWVYILEGKDADLPAQVKWRRNEIIDDNRILKIHEERHLLPEYNDAVSSLAEFALEKSGGKNVYWRIRTLEVDNKLVELLVRTTNSKAVETAEILARSLKPVVDGK